MCRNTSRAGRDAPSVHGGGREDHGRGCGPDGLIDTGRRRGTIVNSMGAAAVRGEEAGIATGNRSDFGRSESFGLTLAG